MEIDILNLKFIEFLASEQEDNRKFPLSQNLFRDHGFCSYKSYGDTQNIRVRSFTRNETFTEKLRGMLHRRYISVLLNFNAKSKLKVLI